MFYYSHKSTLKNQYEKKRTDKIRRRIFQSFNRNNESTNTQIANWSRKYSNSDHHQHVSWSGTSSEKSNGNFHRLLELNQFVY